ncbi:MAG: DUF2169 domain-containing protein [Nannocystaceae bacterium]|nr:DUF2169 domain-containing protein [Nannocystaceae bacterium]
MWELRNSTPYAAGFTWCQDPNGARRWVVAVKGTFDIGLDGQLTLSEEQPAPSVAGEYNGDDGVSSLRYEADLTPPKPGTDLYVSGHAYAPGGRPVTRMSVALGFAGKRKILEVVGDRVWQRNLADVSPSAPASFVQMPLTYERAYGGYDDASPDLNEQALFEANPVGLDHVAKRANLVGRPVANIGFPGADPEKSGAAGFGALCGHWSPRIKHAGTYDAKWVETRKPLPPTDLDPRFHMCAPEDQQFIPHLRGGESVEVVNMNPRGALRFALPKVYLAFKTRIALRRGERTEDHRAKLNTVIVEPDFPRVSMVWHTSLSCHHEADYLESTHIWEKPYL